MNIQKNNTLFVNINYQQTGESTFVDDIGMREMQHLVWQYRAEQYLLVKAPPASGKSRAMMYVALDKLKNQKAKRVIIVVPQRIIGSSFKNTQLEGFAHDWYIDPKFNLITDNYSTQAKSSAFKDFFLQDESKILLCTHDTLRSSARSIKYDQWNDTVLAIDEFHHVKAEDNSVLGNLLSDIMAHSNCHVIAMTGSYFRGDRNSILRPEEEKKFQIVNYEYSRMLNGFKHLCQVQLGYHFFEDDYIDSIGEVLDTTKKTIIHIPSPNSHVSTRFSKHAEVERIVNAIGKKDETARLNLGLPECIYAIRTEDGRLLKVANLVEEGKNRIEVYDYLYSIKDRNQLDIIIALGTAKEGFDWQWCETCLTIGARSSMTEVVQIVGRCLRDVEGKSVAQFINMIPLPSDRSKDLIDDMYVSVTSLLLLEQLLSPKEYRIPTNKETVNELIEDVKDEVKAMLYQSSITRKSIFGAVSHLAASRYILPSIIGTKFNHLSAEEQEGLRRGIWMDIIMNSCCDSITESDVTINGKKYRLSDVMDNVDLINPFEKIQRNIASALGERKLPEIFHLIGNHVNMTDKLAIKLFPDLKSWFETYGAEPNIDSSDSLERDLGAAYKRLCSLKMKWLKDEPYRSDDRESTSIWENAIDELSDYIDESSITILSMLSCVLKNLQMSCDDSYSVPLRLIPPIFEEVYPLKLSEDFSYFTDLAKGAPFFQVSEDEITISDEWRFAIKSDRGLRSLDNYVTSSLEILTDEYRKSSSFAVPLEPREDSAKIDRISADGKTLEWVDDTITEYTIPEGISTIAQGAFFSCNEIQKVTIPSSVRKICKGAFCGCSLLSEIEIPDTVMKIEANVFNQTSLQQSHIKEIYKRYGSFYSGYCCNNDIRVVWREQDGCIDRGLATPSVSGYQEIRSRRYYVIGGVDLKSITVFMDYVESHPLDRFVMTQVRPTEIHGLDAYRELIENLYSTGALNIDNLIPCHKILTDLQAKHKEEIDSKEWPSKRKLIKYFNNEAIINFSGEVNFVRASYDENINDAAHHAISKYNKIHVKDILTEICARYGIIAMTLHSNEGLYEGESEDSFELKITGADIDQVLNIANDMCSEFLQDSVLVKYESFGKHHINISAFLLYSPLMNAKKKYNKIKGVEYKNKVIQLTLAKDFDINDCTIPAGTKIEVTAEDCRSVLES